ncbi:leukemia-associated protein 7 [Dromiciops gliroides]|uniref:leukemia-associated protein 7 n=1 Tax=Dromiciops gliroides TaxID=33562 RepID=UPI001CC52623|nr:leukemia-associated protein 7 [Dromiciops gliroides]
MAGTTHFQACINHQMVALQTLRLLQQQRDREEGLHPPSPVSAASGQAGAGDDGEKEGREGPAVAKAGDEGARPEPRDSGQCALARLAVRTVLARVVESTSQLVQVEQMILNPLYEEQNFPIYLKDSVEFRNICSHMALQLEGHHFDQDLNAAYQCLKTIIKKLMRSVLTIPPDSRGMACVVLRQILQNLLDL